MDALFGRLAVQHGFLTMEQLAEATRRQARHAEPPLLGQVLIELGHLDFDQLNEILTLQRRAQDAEAAFDSQLGTGEPGAGVFRRRGRRGRAAAPSDGDEIRESAGEGADEPVAKESTPLARVKLRTPHPLVEPAQTTEGDSAAERSLSAADAPVPEAADAPLVPVATPESPAARLLTCLREAAELGASDVHVHAGTGLRLRLHGRLVPYGEATLSGAETGEALRALLSEAERAELDTRGQVDFVAEIEGVTRVRGNAYQQLGGLDGVLRLVPLAAPSLADLGLPSSLARLANFEQGLVLVAGPAGAGKTATLAALIDLLNDERPAHVLTIEDPVEYRHPSRAALVTQRQVGRDTRSFSRALRAALREDPDVIVIGELRDRETIALALSAAETGHLVLGTLHTSSVINTISRVQSAFPPAQQTQVRAMLADSLRAVVTQRLVRTTHGDGRVVAHEVLMVTPAVGNLIRESKTHQLRNVMQTAKASGNCLLEDSLTHLVKIGRITRAEAARHAGDARFEDVVGEGGA